MAESKWLNRDFNYGLSIELLVAAGSDVNAADSTGSTPLQVRTSVALDAGRLVGCCRGAHGLSVELLIAAVQSHVNAADRMGSTPLQVRLGARLCWVYESGWGGVLAAQV
jgi:ankyrin repeat protein